MTCMELGDVPMTTSPQYLFLLGHLFVFVDHSSYAVDKAGLISGYEAHELPLPAAVEQHQDLDI